MKRVSLAQPRGPRSYRGDTTMVVLVVLLLLSVVALSLSGVPIGGDGFTQAQAEAAGGVVVPNPVKRPGTLDAFYVFPTGEIFAAMDPVVFRGPPPAWANEMVRNRRMVMEWRPEDRNDWNLWQGYCGRSDCLFVPLRVKARIEEDNNVWRATHGIPVVPPPRDGGDAVQALMGMRIQ